MGTVHTGLFGGKESFVPLAGARMSGSDVTVPYSKDMIKGAPSTTDGHLTQDQEADLYRHYGLNYTERTSDTGLPSGTGQAAGRSYAGDTEGTVGRDVSGPTTDDAMARSEERLRVGTEQVQGGRVRLRKYIVTENVTHTVPVRREEVRIEREPITDANVGPSMSGADLSEEEHVVVLNEERPVVQKETVPVERVRLDKDTVTEDVEVSEQVAKEKIDMTGVEETDRTNR